MRIQDKGVVLTGGAPGLGFATARNLIEEKPGAMVTVLDLNDEAGQRAAAEPGECAVRGRRVNTSLRRLRLPLIAAPMFLISNPQLVLACCRAGIVGSVPALNQRTTAGLKDWLSEIEAALQPDDAPYAVNLIVHRTNPRMQDDLDAIVAHKVPIVLTAFGAVGEVVDAVHSYGGLVFHDVASIDHAERAARSGVDGMILVVAGAGGHAGTVNPFALTAEVRSLFRGYIALAGCISSGRDIAAALALGADFGYVGTRLIATREAKAPDAYKQMLLDGRSADIVYTAAVSGVPANYLRESLVLAGIDADELTEQPVNVAQEIDGAKAWRDIWSAGHGVGAIDDLPSVSELCARWTGELQDTCERLAAFTRAEHRS